MKFLNKTRARSLRYVGFRFPSGSAGVEIMMVDHELTHEETVQLRDDIEDAVKQVMKI